jgi:hypothetical protein
MEVSQIRGGGDETTMGEAGKEDEEEGEMTSEPFAFALARWGKRKGREFYRSNF